MRVLSKVEVTTTATLLPLALRGSGGPQCGGTRKTEVPMRRDGMRRALAMVPGLPLSGWGLVVVRGRSMRPTLLDGDRLLVRHGATPRVGDLVVVRLPD